MKSIIMPTNKLKHLRPENSELSWNSSETSSACVQKSTWFLIILAARRFDHKFIVWSTSSALQGNSFHRVENTEGNTETSVLWIINCWSSQNNWHEGLGVCVGLFQLLRDRYENEKQLWTLFTWILLNQTDSHKITVICELIKKVQTENIQRSKHSTERQFNPTSLNLFKSSLSKK